MNRLVCSRLFALCLLPLAACWSPPAHIKGGHGDDAHGKDKHGEGEHGKAEHGEGEHGEGGDHGKQADDAPEDGDANDKPAVDRVDVSAANCEKAFEHVIEMALAAIAEEQPDQVDMAKEQLEQGRDQFVADCQAQGTPEELACLLATKTAEDIGQCAEAAAAREGRVGGGGEPPDNIPVEPLPVDE